MTASSSAINQNLAIERALAILQGSPCETARRAETVLIGAWQAPARQRAPKPRTLRAIDTASTAGEILMPVGRRKLGKDRIRDHVVATLRDGREIRLTIGRSPRDSEALALEAGRRLAVLFRARDLSTVSGPGDKLAWHVRPDGRTVLSWRADILERAASDVVSVRLTGAAP